MMPPAPSASAISGSGMAAKRSIPPAASRAIWLGPPPVTIRPASTPRSVPDERNRYRVNCSGRSAGSVPDADVHAREPGDPGRQRAVDGQAEPVEQTDRTADWRVGAIQSPATASTPSPFSPATSTSCAFATRNWTAVVQQRRDCWSGLLALLPDDLDSLRLEVLPSLSDVERRMAEAGTGEHNHDLGDSGSGRRLARRWERWVGHCGARRGLGDKRDVRRVPGRRRRRASRRCPASCGGAR